MTKLTESAIEDYAINLFEQQGYSYVYGPDIAPDTAMAERQRYDEVLLVGRLEKALSRINPTIPKAQLQTALKEVQRIHSPDLLTNNNGVRNLIIGMLSKPAVA